MIIFGGYGFLGAFSTGFFAVIKKLELSCIHSDTVPFVPDP